MKTQPNIAIRSNKLIDGTETSWRGDLSWHSDTEIVVRAIVGNVSDVRRVVSLADPIVAKMVDYAAQNGGKVITWQKGRNSSVLDALPVGTDMMSEAEAAEEVACMDAIEAGVQYAVEKCMEAVTANHAARARDARGRFVAMA